MQDQNETSILEDLSIPIKRRTLLPWWIKVFCWVYMIVVIAIVIIVLVYSFGGIEERKLFAKLINDYSSWKGLIPLFIIVFNGFAAWALWVSKMYAVKAAIIGAWMNVAENLISIFVLPFIVKDYHYQSGFQLILLAFYLSKLYKIRKPWEEEVIYV